MSVYNLYGTVSAATDDIAQLDVQFDGHIIAYMINAYTRVADALGDGFGVELSFLSGSMFVNNDARGVIAHGWWMQNFLTTGGSASALNTGLSGLSIPVNAGERIHMHAHIQGSILCVFNATLYVEDGADPLLRRRR